MWALVKATSCVPLRGKGSEVRWRLKGYEGIYKGSLHKRVSAVNAVFKPLLYKVGRLKAL